MSEKVAELLREAPATAEEAVSGIDYDRIVYGAAEKVVESLPYPDKVDYRRIDENFMKAAESIRRPPSTRRCWRRISRRPSFRR